jgi:hypothetical protein
MNLVAELRMLNTEHRQREQQLLLEQQARITAQQVKDLIKTMPKIRKELLGVAKMGLTRHCLYYGLEFEDAMVPFLGEMETKWGVDCCYEHDRLDFDDANPDGERVRIVVTIDW